MASKKHSRPTTPSDEDGNEGKPIDPTMFDGLMQFAAAAGNQTKTDEPDLAYPLPEEGPRVSDER